MSEIEIVAKYAEMQERWREGGAFQQHIQAAAREINLAVLGFKQQLGCDEQWDNKLKAVLMSAASFELLDGID